MVGADAALSILDVGGGRGDLALCVAAAMPAASVTVVDTNLASLGDGAARAAKGRLGNIEFVCADAASLGPRLRPDLVIGLHACGGLTDTILRLATVPKEGGGFPSFLVVPCCFNKHPALRSALCDWTAHGGLSGAEVAALCRLAESKERGTSRRAMVLINTLRMCAVQAARGGQAGGGASEGGGGEPPRLREFSEAHSMRNLVLADG